ncbi:hypothetical protein BDV95DRAFT_612999 [Massariosphaeria phaeospora]|uniref:Uncharacterized protein n=1 Tax=Massariosphaeria phaeospora TaxID=100035 RepID=A0A7C8M1A9_9PLEO|nr:hypothetical protein BDV95DRAFT_612999 [Massariosphaeria phaeospora]
MPGPGGRGFGGSMGNAGGGTAGMGSGGPGGGPFGLAPGMGGGQFDHNGGHQGGGFGGSSSAQQHPGHGNSQKQKTYKSDDPLGWQQDRDKSKGRGGGGGGGGGHGNHHGGRAGPSNNVPRNNATPRNSTKANPFLGGRGGNPLAGWGQENLAAPKKQTKPPAEEWENESNYSDDTTAPQVGVDDASESSAGGRATGAETGQGRSGRGHTSSSPPQAPAPSMPHAVPQTPGPASPSASNAQSPPPRAGGDNRFPPPGTACPKPIVLRSSDRSTRYWYHLVHHNAAPESKQWEKEAVARAKAARKARPGQHPPQDQVCMAVKMVPFKMKEVSDGPRGKVYLLDEQDAQVMGCLLELEGGVVPGLKERMCLLGVGLKEVKGDFLVLAERVEG